MSKLYDIAILGADDPASWLTAAALAGRDLRVALIMSRPPDPEAAPFPWLPLDPSRHAGLMGQAGLAPAAALRPPFAPDLQVIVGGKAIDLAADPVFFERSLGRDLGPDAAALLELSSALDREAARFLTTAAADQDSPLNRLYAPSAPERPWSAWFKKRTASLPSSPPFHRSASAAPSSVRAAVLAVATAALAAPLPSEPNLCQVAMLWGYCRGARPGPGSADGLREQAAARIAKRGAVIEGVPETIIAERKSAHGIRFKSRAIVDAKVLVASDSALGPLLGPQKAGGGSEKNAGARIERSTHFFRAERSTLPEALADRAIIVGDPEKPLGSENLMILSRSPRVPRRETVAVTVFSAPGAVDPASLPGKLAAALPWIAPDTIGPDETRAPLIEECPPAHSLFDPSPAPVQAYENIFRLPSDPLPGWGPAGVGICLQSLIPAVEGELKKRKGRA